MLATPEYLIADLSSDLENLALERRSLSGMKDELGIVFVDTADRKVREQIAKASALQTPLLQAKIDKARKDLKDLQDQVAYRTRVQARKAENPVPAPSAEDVPEEFLRLRSNMAGLVSADVQSPAPPSPQVKAPSSRGAPRQRRNVNPPPPSTSTYYFYQAASGMPIFLHPLDIKILLSHFSSYASFPDMITVRVEAFNEGAVNDDLRKRCKYLGHFPEGADVVFIESDLEGVVGPAGLKNFEQALKMRTTRRKEKGKKEDRAKARAEEKEKERRQQDTVSSWSTPTPISVHDVVVVDSEDDFIPLPSREGSGATPARPTANPQPVRSFASALSSPSQSARAPAREVEDEWDIDAAWHELEQRNGNFGRKKKSNKLVIMGGSGRRR
jgi:hypothetical protein